MRKFKIKNRQKRKYTRHNVPQNSYQLSTVFASILPAIILAIALLTTMLMNLNLREQTVSFQPEFSMPQFTLPQLTFPQLTFPQISWEEMIKPVKSLPNLFSQPIAFLSGIGALILISLQSAVISLGQGLLWIMAALDPRPGIASLGTGIQMFFMATGTIGLLLIDGFARIGELFVQSMSYVGTNISLGANTIATATVEYTVRGASLIALSFGFVFEKIAWFIIFLFTGIVNILTFLFMQLSAFADAVIRVILIPFQVLNSFWLQIKPYADILGTHMGMAGADLANGFASFEELGSVLSD